MANPNWKRGGVSPNPAGRKKMKHSARTIKGAVERFIKKNYTANKLQAIHDKLDAPGQWEMLTHLLPYHLPKQSAVAIESRFAEMTDSDLDKLYNKVLGSFTVAEVVEDKPEPPLQIEPINYSRFGQE